jgi:hypothetical protein
MKPFAILLLALVAPLLGACEHLRGSVAGSCSVFERPPYVVQGKTAYDQGVADNFVESGVAGCHWKRPAPRPASIDAAPGRKVMPQAKRRGLIKRIRDRVLPARVESAPAPAVVTPAPIAPAPLPPRRPIDELLDPRGR